MRPSIWAKEMIEIQAGGPNDPDGSKTAAILSAYFHLEHVRSFRKLLWPRLVVIALVWWLGAVLMSLGRPVIAVGLALIAAGGASAVGREWRANKKLSDLMTKHRA